MRSSLDANRDRQVSSWMPGEFSKPASPAARANSRTYADSGFTPMFSSHSENTADAQLSSHITPTAALLAALSPQLAPAAMTTANAKATPQAGVPGDDLKSRDTDLRRWLPNEIKYTADPLDRSASLSETARAAVFEEVRVAAIESIRLEAEEILEQAHLKAAEIYAQGQRAAAESIERGRQEGLAAAQSTADSLVQMATGIVKEVEDWRTFMFGMSETQVLRLVRDIAGKLFGEGFTLDEAQLRTAFERALTEAKTLGDLRIRANPEDVARLGEMWPAQQTALRGQRIELIPDQDILRGGCSIEGQFGTVDGRLETQMRFIEERIDSVPSVIEPEEKAFISYREEATCP